MSDVVFCQDCGRVGAAAPCKFCGSEKTAPVNEPLPDFPTSLRQCGQALLMTLKEQEIAQHANTLLVEAAEKIETLQQELGDENSWVDGAEKILRVTQDEAVELRIKIAAQETELQTMRKRDRLQREDAAALAQIGVILDQYAGEPGGIVNVVRRLRAKLIEQEAELTNLRQRDRERAGREAKEIVAGWPQWKKDIPHGLQPDDGIPVTGGSAEQFRQDAQATTKPCGKAKHDGDCTIYAARDLPGDAPENGICTCGYGLAQCRQDNHGAMYSQQLETQMKRRRYATMIPEGDGAALRWFRLDVLSMGARRFAEWLGCKPTAVLNVEQGRQRDQSLSAEELAKKILGGEVRLPPTAEGAKIAKAIQQDEIRSAGDVVVERPLTKPPEEVH